MHPFTTVRGALTTAFVLAIVISLIITGVFAGGDAVGFHHPHRVDDGRGRQRSTETGVSGSTVDDRLDAEAGVDVHRLPVSLCQFRVA